MSNFANSYLKYANHLKKINEAARSAPERLVQEIEESYREQLHMAADKIERSRHDYRIVLLAGPSSSGKNDHCHPVVRLSDRTGNRQHPDFSG